MNCWICGQDINWIDDNELVRTCVCGATIDRSPYISITEPPKEDEMGELASWSKENAKYIKIENGESYEGIYNGYKQGVNMNGDPAIIYNLDDKEFKSSSTVLAETMDSIATGSKVRLSRIGEGKNTRWTVTVI